VRERTKKNIFIRFFSIRNEKYFDAFVFICQGVGRRSSRQAKNRIVDQVMTITASSDDSRSNGDEFQNGEGNNCLPEDGESCTGKIILHK
jgi:hypothetical protein